MAETNNKKMNFSLFDMNQAKPIPTFIEKENNGKPFINYGIDNRFPNYIWDLYLRSAVLQSIINGTADYVGGNVINYANTPVINKLAAKANKDGETLEDIIKKVIVDYQIFGGFSLQILRNRLNEISEIYWLDFRNVRLNKEATKAYYSSDWVRKANDFVEYEIFDDSKQQTTSVFYFKGHITRGIYPIPRYNGALAAIETSTEISKFHLNSILNNFSGNFVINFNNGQPDEETQGIIEDKIKEKFSGSSNAGKFLLVFNDGKDNAVTVERIQDDNFDKKYEALRNSTYKEIFTSMRCQPQLFGLLIEGSLFNKEEYTEAFNLYNKTVVQPMQRDIIHCFDKIFNVKNSIIIVPFNLEENV